MVLLRDHLFQFWFFLATPKEKYLANIFQSTQSIIILAFKEFNFETK
jgi:hypothetical protein